MKTFAEIRRIKTEKEDDLLSRPGITGVDVGPKFVKGKKTDEIAIRVYVEKKKDVPAKEKIPATINGVKTDVIERRFVLHQLAVPVSELAPKADTGTYDPLVGGIGIGPCKAVDGYVYVGTLGCLVRDRDTSEILMLSNYHVLAEKWSNGDTICQPSRVDGGSCPADIVGSLLRSTLSDHVDGAVGRITNRSHQCEITEIGPVRGKAVASIDMPVRKRGRTTGLTYGKVDSIDLSVNVSYSDGVHTLKNQIGIAVDDAQSTQFGNSGDSGSVVVDENGKVIGLYFAGTEDGSFGVANPIDKVLEELNVELCVKVEKSPVEEKGRIEKWWLKEQIKEFKEYAFEKPPYFEGKWMEGPPWGYPPYGGIGATPATTSETASVEERLARLESLLGGRGDVEPKAGESCADFSTMPLGNGPNPLTVQGAIFRVFDHGGTPVTNTQINQWGGVSGLNAGYLTEIYILPCRRVKLVVTHFNPAGAIAHAFDAAGNRVATAATTSAQGIEQTLILSAQTEIVKVELKAPQNETLIRLFCHCGGRPEPGEFKELKEKPVWKEHKEKLEPKELKEKPEPKEFKEKPEPKELKEKPEPKEYKEKPEPKELKEHREKPGPKELFEHKPADGGGIPLSPWQTDPQPVGGTSVEERLARLEALLGGGNPHFISQGLRPDLSGGALQNEADFGKKR